jgi:hypothetical protein
MLTIVTSLIVQFLRHAYWRRMVEAPRSTNNRNLDLDPNEFTFRALLCRAPAGELQQAFGGWHPCSPAIGMIARNPISPNGPSTAGH